MRVLCSVCALAALFVACGGEPAEEQAVPLGSSQALSDDSLETTEPVERVPAEGAGHLEAPGPDEQTLRALEALGYVEAAPTRNPDVQGVAGDSRATAGLNLYSSRHRGSAQLIDMTGELVHEWVASGDADAERWMHVEPAADGSLLVVSKDRFLEKLSWEGRSLWRRQIRAHHDVAIGPDGLIYVLVRGVARVSVQGNRVPVLADRVTTLSQDGEVLGDVPLLPLFEDQLSTARLARLRRAVADDRPVRELVRGGGLADVMHTNSIEFISRDIEGVAPAGSILLSFRALSQVAIISSTMDRVLWRWGRGELDGQHDAKQLDNGNLLIFDNGLRRGRDSRVVELDAASGTVAWEYRQAEFYTNLRGGAQRLASGNTLITESDSGHALEVSPEGETVWEFWNPDVRGSGSRAERGVIYRLNRFSRSFFAPLQGGGGE